MKNNLAQLAKIEKYIHRIENIENGFKTAMQEKEQNQQQLHASLSQKQSQIDALENELLSFNQSLNHKQEKHLVVENWRDSWKWISQWCFGLIIFFTTVEIPPEILAILPDQLRSYLIALIALCGVVGRYINQSKPRLKSGDHVI